MSVGTGFQDSGIYIKAVAKRLWMTTTGNAAYVTCRSFWTLSVLIIRNVFDGTDTDMVMTVYGSQGRNGTSWHGAMEVRRCSTSRSGSIPYLQQAA